MGAGQKNRLWEKGFLCVPVERQETCAVPVAITVPERQLFLVPVRCLHHMGRKGFARSLLRSGAGFESSILLLLLGPGSPWLAWQHSAWVD